MDSLDSTIESRLGELPDEWIPLRRAAERNTSAGDILDGDGVARVGHRPWVASRHFAIAIYPPSPSHWYAKYEQLHAVVIPEFVRSILSTANGVRAFGLSLYGIPPSMVQDPPLLDRSRLQCLDIGSAVRHWRREFSADADLCHFGGRVAGDVRLGYFAGADGHCRSLDERGKVLNTWSTFGEFLKCEVREAEQADAHRVRPQ